MKRCIVIVVCLVFGSFAFGQQAEELLESESEKTTGPFLGQSLNWMMGKWKGEGKQRGIAFASELEVSSVLGDTSLLLKRNSSGGYQEVILLGYDMNSKKYVATLYDNRYHTGLFTCTVNQNELDCSQVVSDQDYASQRSYTLAPDGSLLFSIQRKDPQMALRKVLEVVFKKS